MQRRHALQSLAALAGAALTGPSRALLPGSAAPAGNLPAPTAQAAAAAESAVWLDTRALARAFDTQALSATRLVAALQARAAAIDDDGPKLNAILEANPEAAAMAQAMDHRRMTRGARSRLHGVPVLLKDNIDTGDTLRTSAGSLALAGHPAPADARLVQRLRAAGMVVLGKTNLSEWANFRGQRAISGWSGRGGQTRNPHVLSRSPSGSSSGSAVAVAAGLAPLAIGTETDGSLVTPAAMCGVVALKPTVGLVSAEGLVPLAPSQDAAGPMARNVADAAALLAVMADPQAPRPEARDAARALRGLTLDAGANALQGARIGVAREYFGLHRGADALAETALARLSRAGAMLIELPRVVPDTAALGAAEFEVLLVEFKHFLNRYLAARGATSAVGSLAELIDFNQRHADTELRWFGQETLLAAQAKGPLTDPAYGQALATCHRLARTEGLDRVLRGQRLDAIVAPTTGPAYLIDPAYGDRFPGGCSQPAAVAGYPHLTVPMGTTHALPVGLSFFGPAWSEARLLRLGHAFEQLTGPAPRPRFWPTVQAVV
jgi:amidase